MRFLFPLLILAQFGFAQNRLPSFESTHLQTVWVDTALEGAPEEFTIEEFNYNQDSAKLYKSEISRTYYYQNAQLRKIEFKKSGKPIQTYVYDAYGRILEQTRTDEFESIPKITYSYNDDELIAEETVYRITGTVHSITILRFNDQQQLISKEEYRGKDRLNRYWLYSYNSKNDMVSDEYYDLASGITASVNANEQSSPSIATQMKYKYSNGRIISKTTFTNNSPISAAQYKYFPDSLVTETIRFKPNGWPTEKHVEVKYDSARILVKGYYNSEDTTTYRSRFEETYVDGDLVEYKSRTLRGISINRYATFYEYDHKGNWIKKTTYSNGVTLKVEERRIRY